MHPEAPRRSCLQSKEKIQLLNNGLDVNKRYANLLRIDGTM